MPINRDDEPFTGSRGLSMILRPGMNSPEAHVCQEMTVTHRTSIVQLGQGNDHLLRIVPWSQTSNTNESQIQMKFIHKELQADNPAEIESDHHVLIAEGAEQSFPKLDLRRSPICSIIRLWKSIGGQKVLTLPAYLLT
jgi:hypothetical protein